VAEPAGDGAPTSVSSQGLGSEPGVVTVNVSGVVCVADAAVPVMVSGYEPAGIEAPTVKVRVDELPAATDAGTKPALTPTGRPETAREIDSGEPETRAVETVVVPVPPAEALTVAGAAEIEKSFGGAAVTVSVTVVE
jgi:hypothetical protein